MIGRDPIRHEFVEYIPEALDDGVVYVSLRFATAAHLCCCGCGCEVVTPISPADWQLIFDGETISLEPSIGNWNLPCRSHYWIERSRVVWAHRWAPRRIAEARQLDNQATAQRFADIATIELRDSLGGLAGEVNTRQSLWRRILKLFV
jgi:hypothetical protein